MTDQPPNTRPEDIEALNAASSPEAWRRYQADHHRGNGPTIPDTYTPDNDVNPVCGCHRRALCRGCGTCTACDACYCGED